MTTQTKDKLVALRLRGLARGIRADYAPSWAIHPMLEVADELDELAEMLVKEQEHEQTD